MKISFDFDATLSRQVVQDIAKSLIQKGHDVYITTSRFENADNYNFKTDNNDLFEIAEKVGISKENIRFTNMADKYEILSDFDIHLDDDWIEINMINSRTKCIGISVFGNTTWKHKLNRIINERD
tara:strand:+ start:10 stop:384 length:375 start_codon:yes stop_codon:yes gene_type:complete